MATRFLAAVGFLALLGIGAAGVGSLYLVKDRVRVVLQSDTAPVVDRAVLLQDDIRSLRDDVAVLSHALGDNLGRMFAGVDDLRREVRDTSARLRDLDRRLAAPPTTTLTAPAAARDLAIGAPAIGAPAAEAPATDAPATDTPAAVTPVRGTSFLSFELPSRTFVFDREQDFEVVPELSRVGFDAKSTLHDFSGVTQQISGSLHANLADPNGAWTGEVTCKATTLVTGISGRDEAMRENLDTGHHPEVRFVIEGFAPAQGGIDADRQTVRGEVRGTMQIRGVSKALRMPVQIDVDEGKRLCVEGQTALSLPDYQVPVPSQLGIVKMQDEVKVWIALRARLRQGGPGGR